jgi:hypothetical protein
MIDWDGNVCVPTTGGMYRINLKDLVDRIAALDGGTNYFDTY